MWDQFDEQTHALLCDNRRAAAERYALTDEQLELIYGNAWFNIWVPKEFGGLEMELVEGCRLLERLAYVDGGLSWTVTLCAGANMFSGYIDSEVAQRIFADKRVCFGGSGMVAGRALKVEGGYIVSGKWPYATGAPHLTHFTANCPVNDSSGAAYRSFFFDRRDVLVHYDWKTFGLEATASHSFSVQDLFVPDSQAFDLLPENAVHSSPLFSIPFMPFAEATLYVNYYGMFQRFCALAYRYYTEKSYDHDWQSKYAGMYFGRLADMQQKAGEGNKRIYEIMAEAWAEATARRAADPALYHELGKTVRVSVKAMREDIVELYATCGIAAAQRENEMNMVFRNFFTATQHALLNR